MKICPVCHETPRWHFASNTSHQRKTDLYMFAGCKHSEAFLSSKLFNPAADRDAIEAKWDAHAEELFTAYTARWTDGARAALHDKLYPKPPPNIPAFLF